MLIGAAADDAVVEAIAELLVAVVASLSDPYSDIGAPAWERGFATEVRGRAAALGLELPAVAAGDPADAICRETEYVRLFVNGRSGPWRWSLVGHDENRCQGTAGGTAAGEQPDTARRSLRAAGKARTLPPG